MMKFFTTLKNLLFPDSCVGCGRMDEVLCETCREKLPEVLDAGEQLLKSDVQEESPDFLDGLVYSGWYQEGNLLARMIWGLKYDFRTDLVGILAERMGMCLMKTGIFFDVIVPMPLSKPKMRQRGFNQAELLAKIVAEKTGGLIVTDLLERRSGFDGHSQAQSSRGQRLVQVKNVFYINEKGARRRFETLSRMKRVLLIDDVYTTGATMQAAARTLKEFKPKLSIFGLVVLKGHDRN